MVFKSPQLIQVLNYVKEQYGCEPQFLWAKTPNNAVLRHHTNSKWYGALLTVAKNKLGISGDGNIEILNVKCNPALIASVIDNKSFFPAYHMNKEHWITIIMDGSVSDKNVFALIDSSYEITKF